jgi:hypothetical protein
MGVKLSSLPRAEVEAMLAAGKEVRSCYRELKRTGDTLLSELLRGQGPFCDWTHYPAGDVVDDVTGAIYYYHAHPSADGPCAQGHFHTFMGTGKTMTHLVAIAIDARGAPTRLFTTNRWVTGEAWRSGEEVVRMLERFAIVRATPSWPVNRWIGAMIRLFRPHIAALIARRDSVVAAHGGETALEDRAIEVTSALDIDVDRHVAAIRAALVRQRKPNAISAASLL